VVQDIYGDYIRRDAEITNEASQLAKILAHKSVRRQRLQQSEKVRTAQREKVVEVEQGCKTLHLKAAECKEKLFSLWFDSRCFSFLRER
jgi:hypothetical protein